MRRTRATILPLASAAVAIGLVGAAPARAGTPHCEWVQAVQHWEGSFGWSWTHHDQWSLFPSTSITASTGDSGGGTFALDGFFGNFNGPIDGSLQFDDDYEAEDVPTGDVTFSHIVLSGPILGGLPGMPAQMVLQTDTIDCTYTWHAVVVGAGTHANEAGTENVDWQPNAFFPGVHPVPELPQPLAFSGPATVTQNPSIGSEAPQYVPYGDASSASLNRNGHPTPAPAQLSWLFDPGPGNEPLNDACAGATFLEGAVEQDTSFATTDASDPAASCGGGDRSVWFTFFAPETGTAQITTSGSGYATTVSVWPVSQICGALTTEIACGADGATVPVQRNAAYRVQVRHAAGGGNGFLHFGVSVPEPSTWGAVPAALAVLAQMRRSRPRQ